MAALVSDAVLDAAPNFRREDVFSGKWEVGARFLSLALMALIDMNLGLSGIGVCSLW
jgi:hypothetical protein